MHTVIIASVTFAGGLITGTIWGRKIEQKAVAKVLAEFRLVSTESHSAVNRLYTSLPFLKKYL